MSSHTTCLLVTHLSSLIPKRNSLKRSRHVTSTSTRNLRTQSPPNVSILWTTCLSPLWSDAWLLYKHFSIRGSRCITNCHHSMNVSSAASSAWRSWTSSNIYACSSCVSFSPLRIMSSLQKQKSSSWQSTNQWVVRSRSQSLTKQWSKCCLKKRRRSRQSSYSTGLTNSSSWMTKLTGPNGKSHSPMRLSLPRRTSAMCTSTST